MPTVNRSRKAVIAKIDRRYTKAPGLDGFTMTDGGTVKATDFQHEDLVGMSGHLVGNQIFDNAGTGNVVHVDGKANRVWVLVHQDERSVPSAPSVFRPEDLFLMYRGSKDASDIYPSIFAVPEMKDIVKQSKQGAGRTGRLLRIASKLVKQRERE